MIRKGTLLVLALAAAWAAPKKPVYVGVRECAACHGGMRIGNQYSQWLHSKHSQAYARARQARIARDRQDQRATAPGAATGAHLPGLPRHRRAHRGLGARSRFPLPGRSAVRGLPRTGQRVHGRERDARPGGGHEGRPAHARRAGVPQLPHRERLPHGRPALAAVRLQEGPGDHPASAGERSSARSRRLRCARDEKAKGPRFAGSAACGQCHRGPRMGYQYSLWQMSPHARAWATLATPQGLEQARRRASPTRRATRPASNATPPRRFRAAWPRPASKRE